MQNASFSIKTGGADYLQNKKLIFGNLNESIDQKFCTVVFHVYL